ncbi:MAG: response regulator [Thermoflexales bacterium]|nr:response regulator [Thermoflexales bacterium]
MKRVLIVHDDPDMVAALRLPLESAGYQVLEAGAGRDGLRQVAETRPELVILDVALEMAAACQVSLELRNPSPRSHYRAYRHIPILMLTPPHTAASLRSGTDEAYLPADDCLEKPLDPDVLLEKVHRLLE